MSKYVVAVSVDLYVNKSGKRSLIFYWEGKAKSSALAKKAAQKAAGQAGHRVRRVLSVEGGE